MHDNPTETAARHPCLDRLITSLLRSDEGQTLADLIQRKEKDGELDE